MPQTLDTVVTGYVTLATAIERADAVGRWRWAKELSELLSAAGNKERQKLSEEIGAKIGAALNRPAYSGSWVRQHAAAYTKFPQEPADTETQRAFLNAANGNTAREASKDAPKSTDGDSEEKSERAEKDPLRALEFAVKACVAKGIDATAIMSCVQLNLNL